MNPAGILTFPQRFPHLEAFFIFFFPSPLVQRWLCKPRRPPGKQPGHAPSAEFLGDYYFPAALIQRQRKPAGFPPPLASAARAGLGTPATAWVRLGVQGANRIHQETLGKKKNKW